MNAATTAPAGSGHRVGHVVLGGLTLGVLNSLLNHGLGPGDAYTSIVVGSAWMWLSVGYVVAVRSGSASAAFRRTALALLTATVAYFATDHVYAVAGVTPGSALGGDAVFWVMVSVLLSALLAGLVWVIQRWPRLAVVGYALVPAYIAWDTWSSGRRTAALLDANPGRFTDLEPYVTVTGLLWPVAAAVTVLLVGRAGWRGLTSGRRRSTITV